MVAILSTEPDWNALPAATPAGVRTLLQRCLEKDPKRRLRDIGEARIQIEALDKRPGEVTASRPRSRLVSLSLGGSCGCS